MTTIKPTRPYVALTSEGGEGLALYMPDGTMVPGQTEIKYSQDLKQYQVGVAIVTITFIADIRQPQGVIKGKDLIDFINLHK